jgi:argininosuccinate synthase
MKKAILAFSGGLDTGFCVPYLVDKGYEVITVSVNTGGFTNQEVEEVEEKSRLYGASKHILIQAEEDLYKHFASYILKASYLKGGVYPACVGPERVIIAQKIAEVAKQEDVSTIVHGSTGAGNDQVRFETAIQAYLPQAIILAPIREHGLQRAQEVEYLRKKGFTVSEETKDYSINVGLLGTTIGGKETHDTKQEIPENIFPSVSPSVDLPSDELELEVEFKEGLPVKLNGDSLSGVEIIKNLNILAAKYGYGKDYHIGTTIIGVKARIAFESPAVKLLIKAGAELEKLVLTSKQIFWKNHLGNLYGDLIHEGLYFDPLIKNLEAFFDSTAKPVTGKVKLSIYKGNLTVTSLESPNSLFGKGAVYGEKNGAWDGRDAEGFCKLYGLESVTAFINQNSKSSEI